MPKRPREESENPSTAPAYVREHGKHQEMRVADVGELRLQGLSAVQRAVSQGSLHTAIDTVSGKTFLAEVFRFDEFPEDNGAFAVIEENLALGMAIDQPAVLKCYGSIDSDTARTVLWQNFNISSISLKQIDDLHTQQLCILDLLTACAVLEMNGGYDFNLESVVVVDDPSPIRSVKLMVLPGRQVLNIKRRVCIIMDGISPELLRGGEVGVGTAVWGVGVVAFRILTKSLPFGDGDGQEQGEQLRVKLMQLLRCEYGAGKLDSLPPLAADFFASIFKPQKEDRASADALMQHPWFDETLNSEEKAQILCSEVLRELISPGLLPTDLSIHLATYIPYVERWALSNGAEAHASGTGSS